MLKDIHKFAVKSSRPADSRNGSKPRRSHGPHSLSRVLETPALWTATNQNAHVFAKALLHPPASTKAFADSYDGMNFTPPYLGRISARALIVQGDRDPLCPAEISEEMARAIPRSSLRIVPNAGHGPVLGQRWPQFLKTAAEFLRG